MGYSLWGGRGLDTIEKLTTKKKAALQQSVWGFIMYWTTTLKRQEFCVCSSWKF